MDLVLGLSLFAFIANAAQVAGIVLGWRRLRQLGDLPAGDALPPLSVVVPARNERHTIEPALRSLLAADYPGLEVIAVDDRSDDGTSELLDALAPTNPRLRVVHVRELPEGWLGKSHAMHLGSEQASGQYILFCDADVHFASSALRRAMTYMESRRLDHLTLFPEVPLRSAFLQMSMAGALVGLLSLYQPWRAERTGRHGLGVGAFNLVRACAYRALGGHRVIPMDVLDDVELGRLMSETGRQELLLAKGMVSVEIYSSAGELLRGMQKNLFTFLRYSFWMLLAATLGIFAVVVWPWIGLFAPDPVARAVNATTVAILFAFYAKILWQGGYGLRGLAWLPLNGLISIVMFWQVAIRTWIQGGVVWRGTLYPLAELKRRKRG